MNIQVLGAHNCESQSSKFISLLIDDILAIDAGGLTSSLSFQAQQKLKAILLTHQHYDHIRDIPALGMTFYLHKATINIYSTQSVYDALTTHLLNGKLYPNFLEQPQQNPTIKFTIIEPYRTEQIEGYSILATEVNHSVPTIAYQVTSPEGKTVFYTGDTGPGLADCWKYVSPQLLIIEVIGSNRYEEPTKESGHLTPSLLKQELITFQQLKGYLPQVVTVHMSPTLEKEIETEIAVVGKALNNSITLAYEGMQLQL
ncbi:MAG: MBL fold metallo-hydrolase [Dehalococcoidia bacterium]|nr:MAG: MBL fold metallo-hydrolase [Dehalococcoidia bacterium]